MSTDDITIAEGLAETRQLHRDHEQLIADVQELLKQPNVVAIPSICKRMIDSGIDPVVIAKHLLIGDRPGSIVYQLSHRAAHIEAHERAAELGLMFAWQMVEPAAAAHMAVGGAAWLATQFGIQRDLLVQLCRGADRRLVPRADRRGYGAVDLVDLHGGGTRESLIAVLDASELPVHAVLEYSPRGKE